jgi:hypothetical protein
MTDEEIINMLQHPAFNKSYFARLMYGSGHTAATRFHNKLYRRGNEFTETEMIKLRIIVKGFAMTDLTKKWKAD